MDLTLTVLLPHTKDPPRLRAESSALARLLTTGVANSQTTRSGSRNREVDC